MCYSTLNIITQNLTVSEFFSLKDVFRQYEFICTKCMVLSDETFFDRCTSNNKNLLCPGMLIFQG